MKSPAHDSGTIKPEDNVETEDFQFDSPPINPIRPRENWTVPQSPAESNSGEIPIQSESVDITARAKTLRPAIKTIVDLVDSAGVHALESVARKSNWEDEEIEQLAERARMQGDTYEIIVNSGSRIAARYVKSDELLDWVALSGGLTQWGVSLVVAIREIKANRKVVEDEPEVKEVEPEDSKGDE